MNKSALRQHYKAKREELTLVEKKLCDSRIIARLAEFLIPGSHIAIFLPIQRQGEVDLTALLANDAISWCVSRSDTAQYEMTFYRYESPAQLVLNSWGIPEPQFGEEITPAEIDLVLVPMLICDKKGHRVGYGKGFYDRFLKKCRPDCLFVGVNYFEPVDDIGDFHQDDIFLNWCITPNEKYQLS